MTGLIRSALLIAALGAASLLPATARAEERGTDLRRLVAPALIVGAIALYEHDRRQREAARREADRQPDLRSDGWLLPLSCLDRHRTNRGEVALFGVRCLEGRYPHAARLPVECARTVRVQGRLETGFDALCLRHEGFRVSDTR